MVNQVNGILIPGGNAKINSTYGISGSAFEIFNIAKNVNNIYLPIGCNLHDILDQYCNEICLN